MNNPAFRKPFYKPILTFNFNIVLFITISILPFHPFNPNKILAASLSHHYQLSFTTVIKDVYLPVAEYNNILYLSMHDGIYSYDGKNYSKLYSGTPNFIDISSNGKTLTFSEKGNIKTYDLKSRKVEEVLKGDYNIFYEHPTWLSNGEGILFTKNIISTKPDTHGSLRAEYACMIKLKTMEQLELTKGRYASQVKGDGIVFERDSRVIYKSLRDSSEIILDEGNSPRVSPDGKYVVYTKTETTLREAKNNVFIEENLENIWIVNIENPSTKKKITSNTLLKLINEESWLKSIQPSKNLQILSYGSKYCYLFPSWSSDSSSIYAIVRISPEGNEELESNLVQFNTSFLDIFLLTGCPLYCRIIPNETYFVNLLKFFKS